MNDIKIVMFASHIQNLHRTMTQSSFQSHFGIKPTLYMILYGKLESNRMYDPYPDDLRHDHLLYALDFLKRYDIEARMETRYGQSKKTLRKWIKIYVKKIGALKSKLVSNHFATFYY